MDVLFVDVGFGTCHLILTGSGEAIVIDAGKRSKEILTALHHYSVNRIRHLIVSHWHDDHFGGATGLLEKFPSKVGTVWFPPSPSFQGTKLWNAIRTEVVEGRLDGDKLKPLVLNGGAMTGIWTSALHDADLKLVAPSYFEANVGVDEGNENATSGILVLRVGGRRIVFGGDAGLAQWGDVARRMPMPIDADVLAVPHHGGIIWPSHWSQAKISTAMRKLYTEIVRPKVAIVSTGTRPGKKHPRSDVVAELRLAGATIMCTQITHRCTSNLEETRRAQSIALSVIVPGRASIAPLSTGKGQPNHVACAGSVLVELLDSGATIHQLSQHQSLVDRLPNSAGSRPLCRA